MNLTRLIYSSRRRDSAREALDAILRVSRTNNQAHAVTGALIASDEHFLQILEGRRADVTRCFGRILRDARHSEVQIVSAGDVRARLFPEWSMHRIHTSEVRRSVIERLVVDGAFQPGQAPQARIEELCQALSGPDWRAGPAAASPVRPWSSAARRG